MPVAIGFALESHAAAAVTRRYGRGGHTIDGKRSGLRSYGAFGERSMKRSLASRSRRLLVMIGLPGSRA